MRFLPTATFENQVQTKSTLLHKPDLTKAVRTTTYISTAFLTSRALVEWNGVT